MLRDIRLIQPNIIRPKKFSRKKNQKNWEGNSLGGEFRPVFEEKNNIIFISSVKQQARQGQQHVTLAIA